MGKKIRTAKIQIEMQLAMAVKSNKKESINILEPRE